MGYRYLGAIVAATLAWLGGMFLLFGPAQAILANPAYQSDKFLQMFFAVPPAPRTTTHFMPLLLGVLLVCSVLVGVYAQVRAALTGGVWQRGLRYGLLTWAVMVPWFEFYLPYNVCHVPLHLVLLDAAIWWVIHEFVGVVIAFFLEKNNTFVPE